MQLFFNMHLHVKLQFVKMMHAWRGLKGSERELTRVRVQKCRARQEEKATAATAAEQKALAERERARVRGQQQRFRDVRDENFLKGDRIVTAEILVGHCVLDLSGLYEADRVYVGFVWLEWLLDPAIEYPPFEEHHPMRALWASDKKELWREEMYWHSALFTVTKDFTVYDGTAITCITAIWRAVNNNPNDEEIQIYAGRVLVLIVSTLKKMSEGFVFIYMFPPSAVRDLAVTPTVWMQRVLSDIRLQWGAYAAARLPYVVWAQLSAVMCEDFSGWPSVSPAVVQMDVDDDDDEGTCRCSCTCAFTCTCAYACKCVCKCTCTCGPFPRASEEEMARRTLLRCSVRK